MAAFFATVSTTSAGFETDTNKATYVTPRYFGAVQAKVTPQLADDGNLKFGRLVGLDSVLNAEGKQFMVIGTNPGNTLSTTHTALADAGWDFGWMGFDGNLPVSSFRKGLGEVPWQPGSGNNILDAFLNTAADGVDGRRTMYLTSGKINSHFF